MCQRRLVEPGGSAGTGGTGCGSGIYPGVPGRNEADETVTDI